MLVSFSLGNLFSFKNIQTLRMDAAASSSRDDILPDNVFSSSETHDTRILKSALLFGANASGKTNCLKALTVLRSIILNSQAALDDRQRPLRSLIPYLLDQTCMEQPSVLEVEFYQNGTKYRYGLEANAERIHGEWLFYTPTTRETMLFNRTDQSVEFNKAGFAEAARLVKNGQVQQTRADVPFISVLAANNGLHSLEIIHWFNQLRMLSGTEELGYSGFTHELLTNDPQFKRWALQVLNTLGIDDLRVDEVKTPEFSFSNVTPEVKNVLSAVGELSKHQKTTRLIVIKKVDHTDGNYTVEFPAEFESEGTRKLINILGPLYDSIQNKRVLLIDEIEAKFHSLLTRFVLKTYHENNSSGSQIIATAHDTNLMDTRYYRRDQIWLVENEPGNGSQLYSLIEFKEKARQLKQQYGPDYLSGAFGAISLFENLEQIEGIMPYG